MAKNISFMGSASSKLSKQVHMLVALSRSLRLVELCRRDFIVLLGTQVQLRAKDLERLTQEGMLIHWVPPIIPGVPTADKLIAWTLTNYSRLAVMDSDMLFIRSIDALFDRQDELIIAHHPYDHLQAQCGVSLASRGVAALFILRPNLITYRELLRYLHRRFRPEQLLYADQTGLMCFFGNRSQTLPCGYVYDVALTSPEWLQKWMRKCRAFVVQHVRRNCLVDILGRCSQHARKDVCDATHAHVRAHCSWPGVATDVHAVHFKAISKPWPTSALKTKSGLPCRFYKYGVPGVRPGGETATLIALSATDHVQWDAMWMLPGASSPGACISSRWQLPLHWARRGDGPMREEKCCKSHIIMASHWMSLIDIGRRSELGN